MRNDRTLSTKYRPETFDEIVGQDYIKQVIKNQIENNALKPAYLFCGGAGTGKTTSARCLANTLNGSLVGVVEVDCATNNSVADVRQIVDTCKFKAIGSNYKVYILDECHILSSVGWDVYLKTLEEGIQGCVFIFCTTDPQKIPKTILSRVQRFDFKRMTEDQIVSRLKYIIDSENAEGSKLENGISINDGALDFIAKAANGGMRDAITILDKCIDYSRTIDVTTVETVIGTSSYESMFKLLDSIYDRKIKGVIEIIEQLFLDGVDLKIFTSSFTTFLIELVKWEIGKDCNLVSIPKYYITAYEPSYDLDWLMDTLDNFIGLGQEIKYITDYKPIVQAFCLKSAR